MNRYDVVVVGTGFGGAVTGCRLAQGGMRVLLIERGPWWGPAARDVAASVGRALPRGPWGSRKLLRNIRYATPRRSHDLRLNTDGLYEIHRFPRMTVLGASGVGGGSHTYAAIQREPNADFWDSLPSEITHEEMAPYFARVRDMQRPEPVPAAIGRRRLNVAMGQTGMTMERPDLAIDHASCKRCSQCVLGCPHGAKTTLDLTYLPAAQKAGAEIWPLCEVVGLTPDSAGFDVSYHDHRTGTTSTVRARRVIVAAGTLNTVRLLFEARSRSLNRIAPRLGKGFSGNADHPLVLRRPRADRASSGVLVNAAASTGGAYYLDADLPILSTAFQLLVGMCDDSSPAVLRPVKGGLSSNARRDLAPSTYRRMDSAMVAVRTAGHLRAVGASRRLLSAHPLGGAAISETPGGGVVRHTGEVFGHPGLYVADGAILPRAPGVPPSLTIAAFAERIADLILHEERS